MSKTVRIAISAETKDFVQGISKATDGVSKFAQNVEGKMNKLSKTLRKVDTIFGGMIGLYSVKTALISTAVAAGNFEEKMTAVNSILRLSQEEFERLKYQARDAAVMVGASPIGFATAMYEAASAGIEANQIIGFVVSSHKLATAGFGDTSQAVKFLSTVMEVYGDEIKSATKATDMLLNTQNRGKTVIAEMGAYLGKVLQPAKNLNISFETLLGMVAEMTSGGIMMAETITGINGLMNDLAVLTPQNKKAYDDLNISWDITRLRGDGLVKSLKDIIDATGGSLEKLTELGIKETSLNAILLLGGQANEKFAETIRSMAEASDLTEQSYGELMATLPKKLEAFRAAQEGVNIAWGTFLTDAEDGLPILTKLTNGMRTLAGDVTNLGINLEIINLKRRKNSINLQKLFSFGDTKKYWEAQGKYIDKIISRLDTKRLKRTAAWGMDVDITQGIADRKTKEQKAREEEFKASKELEQLKIQNTKDGLEKEIALLDLQYSEKILKAGTNQELITQLEKARESERADIRKKYRDEEQKEIDLAAKEKARIAQEEIDYAQKLYEYKVETGRISREEHIKNLQKELDYEYDYMLVVKDDQLKRLQLIDEISKLEKEAALEKIETEKKLQEQKEKTSLKERELWEKNHALELQFQRSLIDSLSQAWSQYWANLANHQMTAASREMALKQSLERAGLTLIAKQLKAFLAAEIMKQRESKKTTALLISDYIAQAAKSIYAAGASVLQSIASGFKWLISTLGPFGLAAGIGLGAGIIAAFNGFKSSLGFREGGSTGRGADSQPAGVVHKNEYVVPSWMTKKYPEMINFIERIRSGGYQLGGMVGQAVSMPTMVMTPVYSSSAGAVTTQVINHITITMPPHTDQTTRRWVRDEVLPAIREATNLGHKI